MFPPTMSKKEYEKLTKTQKKVYWGFVISVFTIIICLWVYALMWQ